MTLVHCFLVVAAIASAAFADGYDRVTLCEALAQIDTGEERNIEVTGVYVSAFETSALYDPQEPRCRWNVQPATWIEFAPDFDQGALGASLKESDRALVTIRGRLLVREPRKLIRHHCHPKLRIE